MLHVDYIIIYDRESAAASTTSRNTENWQQIFNFLLHRLLWGVSFRALLVSFYRESFVIS